MTIFGPDISSYEQGLDVTALSDPFVIAKCTEGTYYTDAFYGGWRAQAKAARKLFVPYHFLSGEDPGAQADHLAAHIGDTSLPVMVDFEPEGNFSPTVAQLLSFVDACLARHLRPRLAYVPRWYWAKLGSPDLSGLASRGLGVIASAYPGGSGTAEQLYPGDYSAAWTPYGNVTPLLWQFTNQASDGGQLVDMNAYRGTLAELSAFLAAPTPTTAGGSMASYTMSAGWQNDYPDVAAALQQHIPVGTVVDDGDAAAYAMIRSFVAAERAAAIEGKLDKLIAASGGPAPVDVDALAAALAPRLAPGIDPNEVALDVVAHLQLTVSSK